DQDTFTAKRYEENTRNSYGHPVPFVDGTMQSTGGEFAAQVVSASFTDERDDLTLDLKGAYACGKIDRLARSLSYRRNLGQVVVTDVVKLKEPGAFESPIVTFGTVTPKGDGLYEIVYKGGRCRVMCRVQATGGRLVTKSEALSFIGRKNDPRARGVPTRFAFAFAEPVAEASITFTYWIPKADESASAESACVLSAADFGFSPAAEPAANAAALQKALDGGRRTVRVSAPGVYRLDRTIFLDDETTLDCAEGVVFEKAAKYANVFANRGAFGPYRNHDITLKGVAIQVKGFEAVPGADSPAQGLRGQIGFYGIDRLKILNVRLEDFNKSQYAIQVVDFDDFLIDGFVLRGNKDGIHLNCGKNFVIRNGRLRTYDDGIAINAGEWPAACTPRMGSITDGLIENVVDEPGGHCNFARVITGAWREWYKGMPLQFRDIFTVGNDVYAVYPGSVSTNEVVSLTCPTHKQGVWTSPEGINFLHIQSDGAKRADIRRVTFRNIEMNCPRCFSCSWEISGWARLLHPSLPRADYPVIDIRLENVAKTAPGPIIAGNADANIVLENCRAEQGPLVSMRWREGKTQCPRRT
ncbi:MAG: hypothetical protein MJ240_14635, partial [Kiritimatiellae bacterium]|nr:hypothetical protein [Kiritimatiellia bacterium]